MGMYDENPGDVKAKLHATEAHVQRLQDSLTRVGTLALAAIKLYRNPEATAQMSLIEDTLFLIVQHASGYKRSIAELLLDVPTIQNAPQRALPPPKSED